MITEIEDFIHIIEISDLSDIVQTDFNYWYEDWNNILISDLEFLLLELLQKHTTTTVLLNFRKYDQFSTFKTTLFTVVKKLFLSYSVWWKSHIQLSNLFSFCFCV